MFRSLGAVTSGNLLTIGMYLNTLEYERDQGHKIEYEQMLKL